MINNLVYIGETPWVGVLSKITILLSFVAAIFSFISYTNSVRNEGKDESSSLTWKRLGKYGFIVHGVSVFILVGTIFYAMANQMYEYNYVFEHVSNDLPMRYIMSAFWEGQEGSFMLWMMWHVVLGFILLKTSKQFEAPVLAVFALVEIWLSSMILGIYVPFDIFANKIGSNPMLLLREVSQAPIFGNADYLSLIEGNGLNPLLQNYWMTIHPPTLFLGFASTIVPFAYAIAGLWRGEHKSWLRPALKWTLFSSGILGIGILMGSLWAYEALSFGGYWAWDPVENTSLVPWIILVAGVHTNMIANNTGRAIKSTYIFYLLGFLLIVYSTLLTRSGILGDTSAHAFTEMGLEWQLVAFLATFLLWALYLYIKKSRSIIEPKKEESIYSKEFWMFIGALVLGFSGLLIDFSSSLPVYNSIRSYINPNFIGRVIDDPIEHYNKYQLWIAVFVSLLSGITIFLRYNEKQNKAIPILKKLGLHLAIAVAGMFLMKSWISLPTFQSVLLSIMSIFIVSANLDYLISFGKKSIKFIPAALAHIGFGLMSIGLLSSGLNSYHLNNPFLFRGLSSQEGFEEKYVQLIKNVPLPIRGHIITYMADTTIEREITYHINFKKIDKDMNVLDSFDLFPTAMYSNDYSKIAAFNPDTKHALGQDIFTCVLNLPPHIMDAQNARMLEDTMHFDKFQILPGESVELKEGRLLVTGVNFNPTHTEYRSRQNHMGIEIEYTFEENDSGVKTDGTAALGLEGSLVYNYPGSLEINGIRIKASEDLISAFMTSETDLNYTEYTIKRGESFVHNGVSYSLNNLSPEITNPVYNKEEGDIAVEATITYQSDGLEEQLHPVYVIRGNRPFGVKYYNAKNGIHIRLSEIDPTDQTFTLRVATDDRSGNILVPFEVAQEVPRSDYLIFEAKVFPGINYYWIGCLLMMLGLLFSWILKVNWKNKLT